MKTYHFTTKNEKNKTFNAQGWFVVANAKKEAEVTAAHFMNEHGDDDKYDQIKVKEIAPVPNKFKADFKSRFEDQANKGHIGVIPSISDLENLGFTVENSNNLSQLKVKFDDKNYFNGNAEKINELVEASESVNA